LPEVFFPAFRAALDAVHEVQADGYLSDRPFLRRCVMERIAAQYPDVTATDLDFLLDRLARFTRALPWRSGHAA